MNLYGEKEKKKTNVSRIPFLGTLRSLGASSRSFCYRFMQQVLTHFNPIFLDDLFFEPVPIFTLVYYRFMHQILTFFNLFYFFLPGDIFEGESIQQNNNCKQDSFHGNDALARR